jgi:hypothetical protein
MVGMLTSLIYEIIGLLKVWRCYRSLHSTQRTALKNRQFFWRHKYLRSIGDEHFGKMCYYRRDFSLSFDSMKQLKGK